MANRNIQAKLLKIKKQRAKGRRAWAKPYSMKSYAGVSKDIILFEGQTLGTRARAAQTAVKSYLIDPGYSMTRDVLDNPVPPTKGISMARAHGNNAVPKAVAYLRWQSEVRGQGVIGFNHITLATSASRKLMLFFGGTRWFFVEEDRKNLVAKRSIVYASRKRALQVFQRDKIIWKETLSLAVCDLPPPPLISGKAPSPEPEETYIPPKTPP